MLKALTPRPRSRPRVVPRPRPRPRPSRLDLDPRPRASPLDPRPSTLAPRTSHLNLAHRPSTLALAPRTSPLDLAARPRPCLDLAIALTLAPRPSISRLAPSSLISHPSSLTQRGSHETSFRRHGRGVRGQRTPLHQVVGLLVQGAHEGLLQRPSRTSRQSTRPSDTLPPEVL